jgi:hypothetical protein
MVVRQLGGSGSLIAMKPCWSGPSRLPASSRIWTLKPGTGTVEEPDLTGIGSRPCILAAIAQPVSVCHQWSSTGTL